ncbi:MAG: hypothetical protein N4A31_02630 [Rickettsiales bacterium]|jgi:dolichol kinase|nr:hypothetical protein [Rickettsiales bacterium]
MIKYNFEILRKIFHLSSLWIPFLYFYLSTKMMLVILLPLTIISIIIEVSRKLSPELNKVINNLIGGIMRDKEEESISGATYLLIASTISVILFNKEVAILALTVLMISDSFAALIGRKYGKVSFLGKTLEGSLSFFLSGMAVYCFLVIFCDFTLPLNVSTFAIFSATIVELFAKKLRLDDNLAIPLSIGLVFELVSIVS